MKDHLRQVMQQPDPTRRVQPAGRYRSGEEATLAWCSGPHCSAAHQALLHTTLLHVAQRDGVYEVFCRGINLWISPSMSARRQERCAPVGTADLQVSAAAEAACSMVAGVGARTEVNWCSASSA